MTFTLHITTDSKRKDIKERCCEVLAEFLKKEGYFSVEFNPNEIDVDKLLTEIIKADIGGFNELASAVYFINTKEKIFC